MEVMYLRFKPYVIDRDGTQVYVEITPMTPADAQRTDAVPKWQTSWNSDYLSVDEFEKYSVKCGDELIALGAYEILESSLVVHIIYLEAHPDSNPTIAGTERRYSGIGQLLIAYGIKLSIDHGFGGDVVLEAKTTKLADHYVRDFGAVQLPVFQSSAPRFLIADEAAKRIFFRYLFE